MHQKNLIFAVMLTTAEVLTFPAGGAPVVKKLGDPANSNFYGNMRDTKETQIRSSMTNNRAPAVRIVGSTTKSAPMATANTKVVSATPKTGTYIDATRKSGLHNNFVKGLSSKLSSGSTTPSGGGSAVADLTQRIVNLEEAMPNKQETLDAGDGIIIDGKTISVSDDLANLPTAINEINQEIDDLNERIDGAGLSDEYWTAEETETYLQQHYYTGEYVNQIINQIKPKVVSEFVPDFLHTGTNSDERP